MLGGILVALVAAGLFYVLRRPRPHGIGAFRQRKSTAAGDLFVGDPGGPTLFDASGNGRDHSDSEGGWADSSDVGNGAGGPGDAGDVGGADGGGGNGGGE